MKFSTSINIERDQNTIYRYIVTPNAKNIALQLANAFQSGMHSFSIIGSYGTGKSSFIIALENCLKNNDSDLFVNKGQYSDKQDFCFLNIVGDYCSLEELLKKKLDIETDPLEYLEKYYDSINKKNEFLFIVVDEFGKILEHAAKNNVSDELYYVQKFAEFVNNPNRNIVFISTLHQGFNSYSSALNREQRNEWEKVKGRFFEIVFNEPIEQLLYLAAERLAKDKIDDESNLKLVSLYELALDKKFISNSFLKKETIVKLFPIDVYAAITLTIAMQRYGQNERSLFTFLESQNIGFKEIKQDVTYNISDVYDYLIYNFHSYISERNSDSTNWNAVNMSIQRVEALFESSEVIDSLKLVKTIGLLNLFASAGAVIDKELLVQYSRIALGIHNAEHIISLLEKFQIVKYLKFKNRYVLYDGTDINIDLELEKAGGSIHKELNITDKLKAYLDYNIIQAKAVSYRTGTPRFFEYKITEEPIIENPIGEIDGYINLIVSNNKDQSELLSISSEHNNAIVYVYYKASDKIIDQIFEIDKHQYLIDKVVSSDDRVALNEVRSSMHHCKSSLKELLLNSLFDGTDTAWIYKGQSVEISSSKDLNKLISDVCAEVYYKCPIFKNELLNKEKYTSVISTARVNILNAVVENVSIVDLGFKRDKFPPEKSIYLTLLKKTGIHRFEDGVWCLGEPLKDNSFDYLWKACENFITAAQSKRLSIKLLIEELKRPPFKLKQGFIDFWVPIFLLAKKEEYALYSNDAYVPQINKEVLELLQKSPNDFFIKSFSVVGVKLDLFNKYREALKVTAKDVIDEKSFIETIKPFLLFYKGLNDYAKKTKKISKLSIEFRNVIANASDPEKTFFEDLPNALGFKDLDLINNSDHLNNFVESLQSSISELKRCYIGLLNRVEDSIMHKLGYSTIDFEYYYPSILNRFEKVKEYLLDENLLVFYKRLMANYRDRESFLNSISYVVLNKPLNQLVDEEEEFLITHLIFLFDELQNFVELSEDYDPNFEIIRCQLTAPLISTTKQVSLPKKMSKEKNDLKSEIKKLLTDNKDLNCMALIELLNE